MALPVTSSVSYHNAAFLLGQARPAKARNDGFERHAYRNRPTVGKIDNHLLRFDLNDA